jgi:hypothetical protein
MMEWPNWVQATLRSTLEQGFPRGEVLDKKKIQDEAQ